MPGAAADSDCRVPPTFIQIPLHLDQSLRLDAEGALLSGVIHLVQADVRARVWRIITVLPRINSYYLEGHGMKVGNYLPRYEDNRIEGRIAVGGEESNKYRVDESGVTLWGWVEFKRCRRNPT